MKPLLVGELNPFGGDPSFALYHLPRESSGNRLREILGLTDVGYLEIFDRMNLCTGRWSAKAAALAAGDVLSGPPRVVILLGAKVSRAFGVAFQPFTYEERAQGKILAVLPHPSGLNRIWNRPEARDEARLLLSALGALPENEDA